MLDTIRYQLRHLFDFSGRDAQRTFWYWVLFLFIINLVIGVAMSIPMTAGAISSGMRAASADVDPAAAQAAMMGQMADSMRPLILGGVVLGLINVALMAGAMVRRFHDSDKSGLWAGLAAVIYLVSLWMTWAHADQTIASIREIATLGDPRHAAEIQTRMMRQSLLGYVPLVIILACGLFKSTPGANRYGEESAAR